MKYKLVVTDFDGTLYRKDRTIAPQTLKAIKDFQDAGGIFTIATGRMFSSIRQFLAEAGLEDKNVPIASYQGQMVNMSQSGQLVKLDCLDIDVAIEAISELESQNDYVHIYVLDNDGIDRLYIGEECQLVKDYASYCRVPFFAVGKLSDFAKNDLKGKNRHILKVLSFSKNAQELAQSLAKKLGNSAEVVSSTPTMVEIIAKGQGKHKAVECMCDYYKILPKQTICCGDEQNDITMVQFAGLGCAVQNGNELLKSVADEIIPSNNDDGVGYAIRKFALEQEV